MTDSPVRAATPLDLISDYYVATYASLSPITATDIGVPGDPRGIDDFSPEGLGRLADATRETLRRVVAEPAVDAVDEVTKAAMIERLSLDLKLHDAGELDGVVNNIDSPLQSIRAVFDLMPTDTEDNWADIAGRMHNVAAGVDGYIASLRLAASRADGPFPARRQIDIGVDQARELAGLDGFWSKLASGAGVSAPLAADLARGADAARTAYKRLAVALADLHDRAPADDAFGRERYERLSRLYLGAKVDLDETYEWGREELAKILAEQDNIAHQLYGDGTTTPEAIAKLEADVSRQIRGTDELQRWMQETSDAAVAALDGTHFDIAEPLKRLECRIAPTQDGAVYYTGPTADFSRPGRMWWSVPPGVETFSTWQEKTTVYHEGVPGHHLQIGQAVYRAKDLNKWRSLLCWVSGHGEGWALYAEQLMTDLGFQDDPGDRMGMLDAQRLRAARVVLDIGVHLRKDFPGGGTWNADNALGFLRDNVALQPEFMRFELDRYLGWAGQAPSYKVGQRLWEQARDETAARKGADFDLRSFHREALNLGSVGLDVLREALRSI